MGAVTAMIYASSDKRISSACYDSSFCDFRNLAKEEYCLNSNEKNEGKKARKKKAYSYLKRRIPYHKSEKI